MHKRTLTTLLTFCLSAGTCAATTQGIKTLKKPYDDFVCIGLNHVGASGVNDEIIKVRLDVNHQQLHVNGALHPMEVYTTDGHAVVGYTKDFVVKGTKYYNAFIAAKDDYSIAQYRAKPKEKYITTVTLVCHSERGKK